MQICTLPQTDNHASTPPLSFYRPDALPAAQPRVSRHWRQNSSKNLPSSLPNNQHSSDDARCRVGGTTNNRTLLKTSTSLCYAMMVRNNSSEHFILQGKLFAPIDSCCSNNFLLLSECSWQKNLKHCTRNYKILLSNTCPFSIHTVTHASLMLFQNRPVVPKKGNRFWQSNQKFI